MTTGGAHECRMSEDDSVVYQTVHDSDEESALSTSVLMALEAVPGFDMEATDTVVFDTIDLEALDDLFPVVDGTTSSSHVTFPAGQYTVTVTAAGRITVWE